MSDCRPSRTTTTITCTRCAGRFCHTHTPTPTSRCPSNSTIDCIAFNSRCSPGFFFLLADYFAYLGYDSAGIKSRGQGPGQDWSGADSLHFCGSRCSVQRNPNSECLACRGSFWLALSFLGSTGPFLAFFTGRCLSPPLTLPPNWTKPADFFAAPVSSQSSSQSRVLAAFRLSFSCHFSPQALHTRCSPSFPFQFHPAQSTSPANYS